MISTLRIVAVDDEPLALRRIELLLMRIPNVELVGKALSVPEALELIPESKPDVLLLDIKMAGYSGFDLIARLSGPVVPLVIFVTAFDQFATKAFDLDAIDYVLKPIDHARLAAALDKARRGLIAVSAQQRIAELSAAVAALQAHAFPSGSPRYETEIWAERLNEFVRIRILDLDWVEAERDYVKLHANGNSYLLRDTISAVQARLDPSLFMRVRRSALVRIDRVTGIRKAGPGDYRVVLNQGSDIRVGRTYVQKIRQLISPRNSVAQGNSDCDRRRSSADVTSGH
jgi:DNA-binding LytR/AlgR family response regulator